MMTRSRAYEAIKDHEALGFVPPNKLDELMERVDEVLKGVYDDGMDDACCEEAHCDAGNCHPYDDCKSNDDCWCKNVDMTWREMNTHLVTLDRYRNDAQKKLEEAKSAIEEANDLLATIEEKRDTLYNALP